MSWPDFIKSHLIGTGNVSKAAIIGGDGAIWAKSDNFKITEAEAVAAANGFKAADALLGTGLKFEGEKYLVLRVDDERIIGKKASNGFFIYKSTQAIIIAVYEAGVQPEACSASAGSLSDYFKSTGY
ncbi:hypothetical protein L596_020203 [Steinernema carpocapsae]|uniref:Profilin n=1 Tax=Steinernema carpocapsae TaxID=34508 RepID=A0A4V6A0U1_STECR|nr:hypothetical protein L596_020203 [Steinernema carpocapsae]